MRQLPVELSSIGRGIAPHAPADNIKSAPIWQNSGSVMALIRCTLPASKPYPPSLHPFHAPSLFVSPQFPPQFRRYTLSFSFTTSLPSVIYLQLAAYRSLVSLFPSFFFFSPSLSFPFYERNIPYPARSLPLVRASFPRERVTLLLLVHHCHE